jgi:hypothetical protein
MIYPQAPSQQSGIHIIDLMTAAEFRDSGLSKLTPQELNALDAWLNSYLLRFYKRVTQTTTSYGTPDVIESQIDGEFHGWTGDTIFKLTNGQIWQQAEYDYEYEYDYQPDVTIYKTGSGYKMQVKGMDSTVLVKRIK